MSKTKKKYYTVWKGHKRGIYDSWSECQKQIRGFEGAVYKSFPSLEMATSALKGNPSDFMKRSSKDVYDKSSAFAMRLDDADIEWDSLSVDAACSGNPGILEYQGVDTKSGIRLFYLGPFPEGTVNIGEFLAIIHALAYLKKQNSNLPVYTDSMTALNWLRKKHVNTKLVRSPKNEKLFQLVDRALFWLKNNTYPNKVIKWETNQWGEIPADFGRK
ncbi:MAG: ribonuclease H family protein [Bacteroidales bacterium]|jgi:ribonuclease HI|nr:ribonuclease H family protein [Bacteroidales bacterium]